eukprot:scaffold34604_cov164-Amphora_coffeaeformis.AAC.4
MAGFHIKIKDSEDGFVLGRAFDMSQWKRNSMLRRNSSGATELGCGDDAAGLTCRRRRRRKADDPGAMREGAKTVDDAARKQNPLGSLTNNRSSVVCNSSKSLDWFACENPKENSATERVSRPLDTHTAYLSA